MVLYILYNIYIYNIIYIYIYIYIYKTNIVKDIPSYVRDTKDF